MVIKKIIVTAAWRPAKILLVNMEIKVSDCASSKCASHLRTQRGTQGTLLIRLKATELLSKP